jgi:hypothetical protein
MKRFCIKMHQQQQPATTSQQPPANSQKEYKTNLRSGQCSAESQMKRFNPQS